MRYAGILENDFVNGQGVCVSFWCQGCPLHCPGCHNPQTWDFEGGLEAEEDNIISHILEILNANGVKRNLSILGGEPMCKSNADFIQLLIYWVKIHNPNIKIYLWSGYTLEQLKEKAKEDENIKYILDNINMLAAGPFILAERDITLPFVGSRNQKVYFKNSKGEFYEKDFRDNT